MTMDKTAIERMAARELLRAKLKSGKEEWNEWRSWQENDTPNFRFSGFDNKDFRGYNFRRADFTGTRFLDVDLSDTDLSDAILSQTDMINVKLCNATLHRTELIAARLVDVELSGAKITDAKLASTILIDVKAEGTTFSNCAVYGISVWNLIGKPLIQERLIVTPLPDPLPDYPEIIYVENIEIAQFVHLILNNKKIRDFIDTVTSKIVLILGRFTSERKEVLDALREKLRSRNYIPVLFDFEKPARQTTLESVSLLARMARFVIADITDAKSVLEELTQIVPTSPTVPVQPFLLASQEEPGMFDFFRRYPWVLKTYSYSKTDDLLAALEHIILPAETKVLELRGPLPQ